LSAVLARIDQVRIGQGGIGWLEGEPGIGESTLVAALLLVSFAVTAWAVWRRGRPAVVATAVTITLLGCNAWFDLTTASTMSDAVTSAVAGELPLAALLGVLVLRAHRTATTR
jgi:hypothetical protein